MRIDDRFAPWPIWLKDHQIHYCVCYCVYIVLTYFGPLGAWDQLPSRQSIDWDRVVDQWVLGGCLLVVRVQSLMYLSIVFLKMRWARRTPYTTVLRTAYGVLQTDNTSRIRGGNFDWYRRSHVISYPDKLRAYLTSPYGPWSTLKDKTFRFT